MDCENILNPPSFFQQTSEMRLVPPRTFSHKVSPPLLCPILLNNNNNSQNNNKNNSKNNNNNSKNNNNNSKNNNRINTNNNGYNYNNRSNRKNMSDYASNNIDLSHNCGGKEDERLQGGRCRSPSLESASSPHQRAALVEMVREEGVVVRETERGRRRGMEEDRGVMELMKLALAEGVQQRERLEAENYNLNEILKNMRGKLKGAEEKVILMEEKLKCWEGKLEVAGERLKLIEDKYESSEAKLNWSESKLNASDVEVEMKKRQLMEANGSCDCAELALKEANLRLKGTTIKLDESSLKLREALDELEEIKSELMELKVGAACSENDEGASLKAEIALLHAKLTASEHLNNVQNTEMQKRGSHNCSLELVNRWRCRVYELMVQHKAAALTHQSSTPITS